MLFSDEKLNQAILDNDVASVRRLIRKRVTFRSLYLPDGDNPNKPKQNSLLHMAAYSNSVEVTKLLIDSGEDMNSKNIIGETPLHVAARYNSWETADLLISCGADIDSFNCDAKTPLEVAINCGNENLADLLRLVGKRKQID